jgi:hypothetical protein
MAGLFKKFEEEKLDKNFDQSLQNGKHSSGSGRIAMFNESTIQIFDMKQRKIVFWNSFSHVSLIIGTIIYPIDD